MPVDPRDLMRGLHDRRIRTSAASRPGTFPGVQSPGDREGRTVYVVLEARRGRHRGPRGKGVVDEPATRGLFHQGHARNVEQNHLQDRVRICVQEGRGKDMNRLSRPPPLGRGRHLPRRPRHPPAAGLGLKFVNAHTESHGYVVGQYQGAASASATSPYRARPRPSLEAPPASHPSDRT